jgi:hypothetical protein
MVGQVNSGKFRLDLVRSCYVWLGQVLPGYLRLVQVSSV